MDTDATRRSRAVELCFGLQPSSQPSLFHRGMCLQQPDCLLCNSACLGLCSPAGHDVRRSSTCGFQALYKAICPSCLQGPWMQRCCGCRLRSHMTPKSCMTSTGLLACQCLLQGGRCVSELAVQKACFRVGKSLINRDGLACLHRLLHLHPIDRL